MKYTVYTGSENKGMSVNMSGGHVFGTMVLFRSPEFELEASTKKYADDINDAVDSSNFTYGVLPDNVLPPFYGDVWSDQGTSILRLMNYERSSSKSVKHVVSDKGLIIDSLSLEDTDLPRLPWNVVSSGRPLTLSEMGIVDAIRLSGGDLDGKLTIPVMGNDSRSLLNKAYVDDIIETEFNKNRPIGTLLLTHRSNPPEGYLRCNGSVLKIKDFRDLYNAIGGGLSNLRYLGGGKPWEQQEHITRPSGTSLTSWIESGSLPIEVRRHEVAVTKNRVYVLGGMLDTGVTDNVYSAPIDSNGILGSWELTGKIPEAVAGLKSFIIKDWLYIAGGLKSTQGQSTVIHGTRIKSDGTIGEWERINSIPVSLGAFSVAVIMDRVYLMGGEDLYQRYDEVYVSHINSEGLIGDWNFHNRLPNKNARSVVVLTSKKLHLVGGLLPNRIVSSEIGPDGDLGPWSSKVMDNYSIEEPSVIVLKDRVYVLGGYMNLGNTKGVIRSIYVSRIDSNGDLGNFTNYGNMFTNIYRSTSLATSSRLYLLGGYSGGVKNVIQSCSLPGGTNDYTNSYSSEENPTEFKLPEMSTDESLYYYVKYKHF